MEWFKIGFWTNDGTPWNIGTKGRMFCSRCNESLMFHSPGEFHTFMEEHRKQHHK